MHAGPRAHQLEGPEGGDGRRDGRRREEHHGGWTPRVAPRALQRLTRTASVRAPRARACERAPTDLHPRNGYARLTGCRRHGRRHSACPGSRSGNLPAGEQRRPSNARAPAEVSPQRAQITRPRPSGRRWWCSCHTHSPITPPHAASAGRAAQRQYASTPASAPTCRERPAQRQRPGPHRHRHRDGATLPTGPAHSQRAPVAPALPTGGTTAE